MSEPGEGEQRSGDDGLDGEGAFQPLSLVMMGELGPTSGLEDAVPLFDAPSLTILVQDPPGVLGRGNTLAGQQGPAEGRHSLGRVSSTALRRVMGRVGLGATGYGRSGSAGSGWPTAHSLIGTGPRSPRHGAPYTYVTTDHFLVAFDLESLQDLPDREQLADAGLAVV